MLAQHAGCRGATFAVGSPLAQCAGIVALEMLRPEPSKREGAQGRTEMAPDDGAVVLGGSGRALPIRML